MNARRAIERVDRKAGIVGKGRQAGCLCRGFRLDARVLAERRAGFLWFAHPHLAC